MNEKNILEKNGDLTFFGKVNASISHELKNILAIISETAGLLQDLTEMAANGQEMELEMLKTCSRDIMEEIQRGFSTIKQMNRFSHSVDEPVKAVDLAEILDLVINLAGFLSTSGKVRFEPPAETAVTVTTCPWVLQELIYQALVFAFKSLGPDGEMRISLQQEPKGGVRLTFSDFGSRNTGPFATEKTQKRAAAIGVAIRDAEDFQSFDLIVPENIETAGRL